MINALLVDDHALFRESLSRALADEPDLTIQH
jgi:DNA-binding NarL/FixJ family response regulator